jgi:hypothetical protein
MSGPDAIDQFRNRPKSACRATSAATCCRRQSCAKRGEVLFRRLVGDAAMKMAIALGDCVGMLNCASALEQREAAFYMAGAAF